LNWHFDDNAHPSQKPAQIPEANREHGARDVLPDAVASALEKIGDVAVVRDSTLAQSIVVQATSSTQKDSQSEPCDIHANPGAEADFGASQPRVIPQGSASMATETNEAKTPTPLTWNGINDTGLQDVVTKSETTTSPTNRDYSSLGSAFSRLYLDEDADPLDPQCCFKLTDLTTRDELFTMEHDDLQDMWRELINTLLEHGAGEEGLE
jgi:hypothetical protein